MFSSFFLQVKSLEERRRLIRTALQDQVFPMLERWAERATKMNEV
jgi:hypothetical protein